MSGWQSWESPTGAKVARGGPGSVMYVPRGCPHAFANPGPGPSQYQTEDPARAGAAHHSALTSGGEIPHNVQQAATRSGKLTGHSAEERRASSGTMSFLGG